MNTKIQEKLKLLPDKPGVYKMFNAQGELIYVGKAVNLKNRVRSRQNDRTGANFNPKKTTPQRFGQWFQTSVTLIL